MTNTPISAVVVGLGVHGVGIATLLAEAGVNVVGASDPRIAGQDLADVTGREEQRGVAIQKEISELPWSESIDIAVLTPKVSIGILTNLAIELLQHDTNVVTLVEDAFDLERFAPADYERLNAAALAAGRSFVATGSQDVLWAGLVTQLSSQQRDLKEINIQTHLGVDGYPEEFVTWCSIGNTPDQFEETAAEAATTPSVFGAVLPVIATRLGLTITDEKREITPVLLDYDLPSETLGRDIPAGQPAGRRDVVTVATDEGITLSAELQTTGVMGHDEFTAVLEGSPRATLRHEIEPAHLSVDAGLVNRIPDVVTAPAGVIRTVDLPLPTYRHVVSLPTLEGAAK
ncbi:hypothetical protein [Gulosibacter molinativorax]|uniref:2,4-diaminopentanoate dehydrogenase C-terminal domain-containing protein n=1 Tax=Gulosibacter molinativorax TaxID=256821 RepID=A0ABT7CAR7_9MICO|nr:hypothetical protein [Gulosibacter molinativorax]MDJ1372257.1 hypothetical protein [Gulosibacter molinativorax]QUY63458.1 Hypotetical protein [Gulosibacter molinativorax]